MHSQPWVAAYLLPDGTIAQGDRQHIALNYSGILAAGAAALGGPLVDGRLASSVLLVGGRLAR